MVNVVLMWYQRPCAQRFLLRSWHYSSHKCVRYRNGLSKQTCAKISVERKEKHKQGSVTEHTPYVIISEQKPTKLKHTCIIMLYYYELLFFFLKIALVFFVCSPHSTCLLLLWTVDASTLCGNPPGECDHAGQTRLLMLFDRFRNYDY